VEKLGIASISMQIQWKKIKKDRAKGLRDLMVWLVILVSAGRRWDRFVSGFQKGHYRLRSEWLSQII
jgi:hypothetical protein